MKKFNVLSMLLSVAVVVSLIVVSSCEGPEGPAGKDGADGEDGIDGQDGNATCGVCHDNSESVEIKIAQWGTSLHAIGGHNFENRTTCAPCHTSQGFKEVVNTANTSTAAEISDPANINCYTCHKIHDTYSVDDWSLRVTDPHPSWLTGTTFDYGTANLCTQCHQPRISYPIPDVTNPDGAYEITSSRFGPHYGAQSSTLIGDAYYLVGSGYPPLTGSGHHEVENTCVTCHMGDAIGYTAGGHSFNIYDEEEEAYVTSGCASCHAEEDIPDMIAGLQSEVDALMVQLGDLLAAAGVLNLETGGVITGPTTNKIAGACWNYRSVYSDYSHGVHNPSFVKKVLENSIASLQ